MRCPTVATALLAALMVSATADGRPCLPVLPSHIRVTNCRLAASLADGLVRSPTLRQLVEGVAALHGIVYVVVEPAPLVNKTLLGALSHRVSGSGSIRVLRINVRRDRGDAAVATVAHELRHATELLEDTSARTDADVSARFARIGVELRAGVFETDAAIASERAVFRELHESRRHSGPQ
jgi:hypothetical protein